MTLLEQTIQSITPTDKTLEPKVRAHLDNLTKPPSSLGRIEDIAAKICLITGTVTPALGPKRIYTFAGDHGIADEGVSAFPKDVTPQMVMNMLQGGAAINVLARHVHTDVRVVDIGVDDPLEAAGDGLLRKKVRPGTANMTKGPAMSVDEARQAVEVGIGFAHEAKNDGIALLGTGDMGIGNTSPSSALLSCLLPCSVEGATGRGTGIDDDALKNKIGTIKKALAVNNDRLRDPLHTLAAVGGLEIAGIAGLILGAASCRIPVVVDGFISSAGALVACRMCETVKEYLFFSHQSAEAGHGTFFEIFGTTPLLSLGMRLGEGTGAALAMPIIEAAVKIYNEMATFESAGVSNKD